MKNKNKPKLLILTIKVIFWLWDNIDFTDWFV
jgi:hypothetical protein